MIPAYDADLFSDEALADPYDHYRRLRDLGPVVWLSAHDVYAVTRYADVRAVLDNPEGFCSGQGVGFNDFINEIGRGTTLMSDGDQHKCLREVILRPLTPKALADIRPDAQALADQLADQLAQLGSFDAVSDLAEVLPSRWVPDLLGWPEEGRDHLINWGGASFDALGPANSRGEAGGAGLLEMAAYAHQVIESQLPEGSMAAGILAAAGRGEIDEGQCPFLVIDYLAPSLDTTISALGNTIWLFATHPDQWQLLRREPDRVKQAFNEILRVESPIQAFTRVTTQPMTIDDVQLPAGARVMVSYASANRDERRWENPDRFDITRNSAAQVAFGHGEHACAGMGLARLEGAAVLSALIECIDSIELAGPPVRKINNLIRSFASLPVTVQASSRSGGWSTDSPIGKGTAATSPATRRPRFTGHLPNTLVRLTRRKTLGLTTFAALPPVDATFSAGSARSEKGGLPVAPPGPCQAMIEMYLLMHRTFRESGVRLAQATASLADRPTEDPRRARSLHKWFSGFAEEILVHHKVEDTVLFPTMQTRVPADYATCGPTLHADHAELDVILAALAAALGGRDPIAAASLAARLRDHLDEHLNFEDRYVVPLLIKHLTAADRKLVTRQAWKVARPRQALFTVPWLLSPLDPAERIAVATKVPFVGMSLVWRLTRRRYARLAGTALG